MYISRKVLSAIAGICAASFFGCAEVDGSGTLGDDLQAVNVVQSTQTIQVASEGMTKKDVEKMLRSRGIIDIVKSSRAHAAIVADKFDGFNKKNIEGFVGETMAAEKVESVDIEEGFGKKFRYMIDKSQNTLRIVSIKRDIASASKKPVVSKDKIRAQVVTDMKRLGLKGVGRYDIEVRALKAKTMDSTPGVAPSVETLAFKARVRDTVYGEKLRGRKATFTYYTDGNFQKLVMHWPEIAQDGMAMRKVASNSEIVDLAYDALKGNPLGKQRPDQIQSGVGYELIDGQISQVLYFKGAITDAESGATGGHLVTAEL
ncbi:MAG: hypothetical protein JXR76_11285 [Deltaproteobacteria bacterium]|nr:hypothetical protein [Deltaproteobacteria bacterium]